MLKSANINDQRNIYYLKSWKRNCFAQQYFIRSYQHRQKTSKVGNQKLCSDWSFQRCGAVQDPHRSFQRCCARSSPLITSNWVMISWDKDLTDRSTSSSSSPKNGIGFSQQYKVLFFQIIHHLFHAPSTISDSAQSILLIKRGLNSDSASSTFWIVAGFWRRISRAAKHWSKIFAWLQTTDALSILATRFSSISKAITKLATPELTASLYIRRREVAEWGGPGRKVIIVRPSITQTLVGFLNKNSDLIKSKLIRKVITDP